MEFDHARNEPPSWIWMLVDPGNEFAITHDAMLWNARAISTVDRTKLVKGHFTELNDAWKQQNLDLLAPGTIQLL